MRGSGTPPPKRYTGRIVHHRRTCKRTGGRRLRHVEQEQTQGRTNGEPNRQGEHRRIAFVAAAEQTTAEWARSLIRRTLEAAEKARARERQREAEASRKREERR